MIISKTIISPFAQQEIGSWSSYWATQISSGITQQYYWWDNASFGNTRRIRILHALTGGVKGIDYTVTQGSDAHYEISNIQLVDLANKVNGDNNANIYQSLYGLDSRMETLRFTGTKITHRINRSTDRGIYKALILPGSRTFRGGINLSFIGGVNSDKQSGYFYLIQQAGDYSALHASLSSLSLYDVILYEGGAWTKYTSSQYSYTDVDTYAASTDVVTVTLFEGLTLGTYTLGCCAIGTKNASSTGYLVFPTVATTILTRPFTITGGTPNCGENPVSLINTGTAHWEMSTTIKKNGTAQTAGWIPEHTSTSGTQLNYHSGEDVQYDANGTAITGYNTGDLGAVACPTFTVTNVSYAVNVAAGTEELLKVTTVIIFTAAGINIKNTYEGLIETYCETVYSYMLPWSTAIFNKWVSDYRQELALPGNGVTTNVTDGTNRKEMIVYNDTAGGTYENYLIALNVPNPTVTNKASTQTSFLYNYGSTYGKFYLKAAVNDVISVGESYTTEINVIAGLIAGLIAKVDAYVGS